MTDNRALTFNAAAWLWWRDFGFAARWRGW
jgi:hypothetical protein